MSKIQSKLLRKDNEWVTEINIRLDYTGRFDLITIQFVSDNNTVEILSSSRGFLRSNTININAKTATVKSTIYTADMSSVDCLISYYNNGDLAYYEALPIVLDRPESALQETALIRSIKMPGSTFHDKILSLQDGTRSVSSPWSLVISVVDDIIVKASRTGQNKSYFAFGSKSTEILASDFVFSFSPVQEKAIIPKEIFWMNYDNYSGNTLGCYEIMKADLCGIDNVYYKTLVSNLVEMSSLPRKTERSLDHFTPPIGHFDQKWWMLDRDSNLPIYVGTK